MTDDIKSSGRCLAEGFLKLPSPAPPAAAPTILIKNAHAFVNEPKGGTVMFGFNVPQTGAYADEGADELRAYRLAVKHLNGEGDGGLMNTMKPLSLRATACWARRSPYTTGDTQTNRGRSRVGQAHDRKTVPS